MFVKEIMSSNALVVAAAWNNREVTRMIESQELNTLPAKSGLNDGAIEETSQIIARSKAHHLILYKKLRPGEIVLWKGLIRKPDRP